MQKIKDMTARQALDVILGEATGLESLSMAGSPLNQRDGERVGVAVQKILDAGFRVRGLIEEIERRAQEVD